MLPVQILRITATEPVDMISGLIAASALRHDIAVEIAQAVTFNAPFCGDEYFTHEVSLQSSGGCIDPNFDSCMREIESIVETGLANGYVENR